MKNYSRAYNRHKKQVKFIKRINIWFSGSDKFNDKDYYKDLTLKGKHFTFLRTTSRPCNCFMCTYKKYNRIPKHKVIKEAFE